VIGGLVLEKLRALNMLMKCRPRRHSMDFRISW